MKIKDTFKVLDWQQADIGINGEPLAKVSAQFESKNALNGKFFVEYLMYYTRREEQNPHDAQASYGGFILFEGEAFGRQGKFVMLDNGVYSGSPTSTLQVVGGSGTGGFEGIVGEGKYYAENGEMIIELDCEF